ncbi:MAG: TrmO family methyltransferase domain-containing protein [Trichloromonadaceae bacterium]
MRLTPIGLSVLKLIGIAGHRLAVENVDMLDGTPLLDIKPYVPAFDRPAEPVRSGWLAQRGERAINLRSDQRFGGSANQGTDP